ncbi:hypothetical protein Tco_0592814 [Tanacetum coccineum]
MEEKGDSFIFVGYSTQSRGYRVYNKRTRMKVETIHVNFNESKEMASDHNTSGLARQRLMTTSEQNSLGPAPKCQDNLPSTAITDNQSMSELDILVSLMFDEYFKGVNEVVSKPSVVSDQKTNKSNLQTNMLLAYSPP